MHVTAKSIIYKELFWLLSNNVAESLVDFFFFFFLLLLMNPEVTPD